MADWTKPTPTDLYTDVLDSLKARDNSAVTLNIGASTSLPTGAIRYERTAKKFQEWNGSAWIDLVISVAGGGTGGSTPGSAGSALGLGTMSIQNAPAVAITGGSIIGITSLSLSADILFNADGTRNVGSNTVRPNNIYIRNGLVIPVGTDKWVTA